MDKKTKATVTVVEKNGAWYLKTNIGKALEGLTDGIICTEILGKAFEPEQRFENRDGSDIIFDRDYLGEHRGSETVPGPLATIGTKEIRVF